MATSKRKKNYLNVQKVKKRIKKLQDEALRAEMMDNTSLMLMKLNDVEVLKDMLDEYEKEVGNV